MNTLITDYILVEIPQFRVLQKGYLKPDFRYSRNRSILVWSPILNIDDVVLPFTKKLHFDLSFPFDDKRTFTIYAPDCGFTMRFLIDEIRRAYRSLFRHCDQPAARWENNGDTEVYVVYGHSTLYVDQIYYSESKQTLMLVVDGDPKPNDSFKLPF